MIERIPCRGRTQNAKRLGIMRYCFCEGLANNSMKNGTMLADILSYSQEES